MKGCPVATLPLVAPASPLAAGPRHPVAITGVRLDPASRLGAWQLRNAAATIPHCIAQLEEAGNLDNFRRLIGESTAEWRGFWFADSDLYKTIEAVAWEIARTGTREFDAWLDDVIGLVARVQEPDGYVMTWIQGVHPEKKFAELDWTHEMYVLGHMVQAAVALARAGRTDLLDIAVRFVDLVDATFGPATDKVGYCGHPELETALVELYRHTGERRFLDLARHQVDHRGSGLLKVGSLGARYFQDHATVRESTSAVGHAVRQLYLNAGVTDLVLEEGDQSLLAAMRAQWDSAHERKMYITGAFGSRHRDEAFGDDYELPSDRAYAETCATIADLHWNWRMYLAEGGARYAETIERELHNALAASLDGSGTRFFYSNPLQLRPDRYSEESAPRERTPWYACACCPPNIARVFAQLSGYVASIDGDALALHLYTACEIDVPEALGGGIVVVRTSYPDDGRVEIAGPAGLPVALRIPSWADAPTIDGQPVQPDADGYARVELAATPLALDLPMAPRWTQANHRVDSVRGCLALERGPQVYCVEQVDLPEGIRLDDVIVDATSAPIESDGGLEIAVTPRPGVGPLYGAPATAPTGQPVTVRAIPFHTWGNRASGAMRVWLPNA
ncbi:glycoside hydrolase family 127 protein [Tessaracoccus sp. MC1627]|nr:beta-L-arabinofuranosidase domain-containing protein [Tessaracoccus sp. MC1627]MBB1513615.1 glycoside hydrolase family 127 protein [Tessaracoccus sp. MC1627]